MLPEKIEKIYYSIIVKDYAQFLADVGAAISLLSNNVIFRLRNYFEKLKKERNAHFNQYNTKSLNKTYDGFREELGAYCCAGNGDFVNMIAIRDYAKKLGTVKIENEK